MQGFTAKTTDGRIFFMAVLSDVEVLPFLEEEAGIDRDEVAVIARDPRFDEPNGRKQFLCHGD